VLGSIRVERLDRSSANGDALFVDGLHVGAVNLIPARLNFLRAGEQLALSWPAAGMGFQLQSASTLTPPILWNPMTNGIRLTNGQAVVTTSLSGGRRFFRLKSP